MFWAASINHQLAPLSIREALYLSSAKQQAWLEAHPNCIILSTCNRLELYGDFPTFGLFEENWASLLEFANFSLKELRDYDVYFEGDLAAKYLFEVTAGMQSLAFGETQILGQVIRAYEVASPYAGPNLLLLFRAAIHSAKRIHTETPIHEGQISLPSLAIQQLERQNIDLSEESILIIGTGQIGQTTLKALLARRARNITLINRTDSVAHHLAQRWDVSWAPYASLKDSIASASIVFCAANSPYPFLDTLFWQELSSPVYIIDLGMPRNVIGEVANLPCVWLLNLDSLQLSQASVLKQRKSLLPMVEQIIYEELSAFYVDYQARSIAPTIQHLRAYMEGIRQAEISRVAHRLNENELDILEAFSQRLINKLLHEPTMNLKSKAVEGDGLLFQQVAHELFGLPLR